MLSPRTASRRLALGVLLTLSPACDEKPRAVDPPAIEAPPPAPIPAPVDSDAELSGLFAAGNRKHWVLCNLFNAGCPGGPAAAPDLVERLLTASVQLRPVRTIASPGGELAIVEARGTLLREPWKSACSEVGVLTVTKPRRLVARRAFCSDGSTSDELDSERVYALSPTVLMLAGDTRTDAASGGAQRSARTLYRVDRGAFEEVFEWSWEDALSHDELRCSPPLIYMVPARAERPEGARDLMVSQLCPGRDGKRPKTTKQRWQWDGTRFVQEVL